MINGSQATMLLEGYAMLRGHEQAQEEYLAEHMSDFIEIFSDEMPYGTAKARDGDPYEWLHNRLDQN